MKGGKAYKRKCVEVLMHGCGKGAGARHARNAEREEGGKVMMRISVDAGKNETNEITR